MKLSKKRQNATIKYGKFRENEMKASRHHVGPQN